MSKTQRMASIAILASCSMLLYYFKIPLPFFPPFLTLDLSDLPALIGAITMGPAAGILVQLIKNMVEYVLHGSYVGFPVGQFANFVSGSLIAGLIGLFYYKRKKVNGKSILLSILIFLSAMYVLNYYVILPAIMNLLGLTVEQYTASFAQFNPMVKDLRTAVLFVIIPFNLIKISMVYLIGLPFTFKIMRIMRKRSFAI
ncbi:ECF transporter S component [Bacillus sp. FJAT-42376]|uniref:ECF transporter S component n=1 Tax=Bacillus sp. FJAT-42376 TaxID=2014076 RepID=UPI000F4DDB3F|nr:ECF transporter S component [Bacillus sp. FJAT-42376]AZB41328.1 ECF transporter S component [Bacillus sp. FJAT-42376]